MKENVAYSEEENRRNKPSVRKQVSELSTTLKHVQGAKGQRRKQDGRAGSASPRFHTEQQIPL